MTDILEYQASEAKARWAELLDEVERGRTVLITRHGKTIARVVPEGEVRAAEPRNRAAALEWFWVESEIADRLYDSGEPERATKRATETADQMVRYLGTIPASDDEQSAAQRLAV